MVTIKRILQTLSNPRLFNLVLPLVMIDLVAGTIAQKYIGLYEATGIFFSDPLIWLGPFPLPGLPLLLGVIILNLSCKLALKSPWNRQTAGIIITHLGALLLLSGGLITALFSEEGFVDLFEGQEKSFVSDYHARELVLLDENENVLESYDHADLYIGQKLHVTDPPFVIEILETCRNCEISLRKDADANYIGMASKMRLTADKTKIQDEENLSGTTFSLKGTENDGTYLTLEDIPKRPEFTAGKTKLTLAVRKAQRSLPFTVRLLDFRRELYPGTQTAKSYESTIEIIDGPTRWQTLVGMNQPVRYKGHTLFQSSFALTPDGELSVLAVVKNSARVFPYISGLAICLGLILHLFIRAGAFSRRYAFMLLVALACATPASAKDTHPPPMEVFANLPILHEGRIKPLDSFARATLKRISSSDSLKDMSAIEWLAESLFNPSAAESREIIKIHNPELRALLNLPNRPGNRFSIREATQALANHKGSLPDILKVPDADRSPSQRDFIILHENIALLDDVMSSFSLLLPLSAALPENVPQSLNPFAQKTLTWLDTLKFSQTLEAELKSIVEKKGQNIDAYNETEQAILFLSFSITGLRQKGTASNSLKIIATRSDNSPPYLSPWAIALEGSGSPQTAEQFRLWQNLAGAYQSGNRELWTQTIEEISKKLQQTMTRSQIDRLQAEYHYNRLALFNIALPFFFLAAATLAIGAGVRLPFAPKAAFTFLALGVTAQIFGLCLRIYILQRPPVTTLYESIIFVTAFATCYALLLSLRNKGSLWLSIGATSGIILGLLGLSHDTDSDSMIMLTAVLNTNFWLATHVLCIATGYAFSLLTSFIAHTSLLFMLYKKTNYPPTSLYKPMATTALLALLFSAGGTILGGVWADQSWGRFWGWDPKENGALLLVLWLIWVIHGRISGQFSSTSYTAGLAFTLAIVAISWFGVNLLSVGLHAYGFTESAAWVFWSVLILETFFCSAALFLLRAKRLERFASL